MQKLERTMTSRHIMMMALGGAIGAGLFKGSSKAIDLAGPSVMIAYLIGGVILLFIMQGLAEMAVRNSEARTFRDLVQSILGPYAAYFLDWIYWKMWVLILRLRLLSPRYFCSTGCRGCRFGCWRCSFHSSLRA